MTSRISAIVIDAVQPQRVAEFWCAALDWQVVDLGQSDDVSWVVLADPEGNEFSLLPRTVQEVT